MESLRTRAVFSLVSGLLAVALVLCVASSAPAAIYWSSGTPIGRSNLDGSASQGEFIKYVPFASPAGSVSGCADVAVDATHVFWSDPAGDAIGRANLDGSNADYTFITGAQNQCGIAVDDEHVYWTNFASNAIGRAKLDGSEPTQTFINAVSEPCGVAVDRKFIYWTSASGHYVGRALVTGDKGPHLVDGDGSFDFCGVAVNESYLFWGGFGDRIGRVSIDGSNPDPSFISGLEGPCGVAVDGTRIYWSERVRSGRIESANLDGAAQSQNLIMEEVAHRPCGVAVDGVSLPQSRPQSLSRFSFGKVRYNQRRGVVFLPVDFPGGGYLHVRVTPGFSWKLRPDRLIDGVLPTAGQRWLKIWPGGKGGNGQRARKQLKARGGAVVGVEVEYAETDHKPTTKGKRIKLLKSQ